MFFTVWTNQFTDIPLPLVINNILAVIHIIFVGSAPMMYYLFVAAAAFQFIHPDVLLFGFLSAISLMAVSFTLKSPQELMDQNLGFFNRTAFKDFLYTRSNKGVMAIIHINNVEAIKYIHGLDNGYTIIRNRS